MNATRRPIDVNPSSERRFWGKVTITPDCWLWDGAKNPVNGYGNYWDGQGTVYPHRFSFEYMVGHLQPGEIVDHRCRNKLCVNPTHLRLSSKKRNNENRSGCNRTSSTGVLGVSYDKRRGTYWGRVHHNRRLHSTRAFSTLEEAGEATRLLRLELFTDNDRDR